MFTQVMKNDEETYQHHNQHVYRSKDCEAAYTSKTSLWIYKKSRRIVFVKR